MAEQTYEMVANIEGLYDEKSVAISYDITHKGIFPFLCVKHHFINASLHRYEGKRYLPLYDGQDVRCCKHCKKIDCVHKFNYKYYEVRRDKYYAAHYKIGHCQKCHRRIYTSSYSIVSSSQEARDLIEKKTQELGVTTRFGFDFDTIVSQMMEEGQGKAEHYIERSLLRRQFDINDMKDNSV